MMIQDVQEKAFNIFLKIFLIGSMVFFVPNQQAYIPQELFISFSAMIFLAFSFFVRPRREISNFSAGLLLMYLIAVTLFISLTNEGKSSLLNAFFGFVIFKVVAERVDVQDVVKFGRLFMLFCVANIVLLSLQVLNRDPIFSSMNPQNMPEIDKVGFMGVRFALGCIGALMTPFIYAVSPIWCIAVVPLLIFGKSSTAIAAAVISFMFLLWFDHRRAFWILLALMVPCVIAYPFMCGHLTMSSRRFGVWLAGISLTRIKPWFGQGLGAWNLMNFTTIQANGEPQKWIWAHNEFVQLLFEAGIAGLICLYAFLKRAFSRLSLYFESNRIAFAALISLLIVSFFHFPFHIGRLAGMGLFILSFVEATNGERA